MNLQETKPNQKCKLAVSLLFVALLTFVSTGSAQLRITGSSQTGTSGSFTPSWTPATIHLLANVAPTTATGNFFGNFGSPGTGGTAALLTTVGNSLQVRNFPSENNIDLCGSSGGTLVVYTMTNGSPAFGYNITNISVYGSWQDNGRDAQDYTISYSTVSAPATFTVLRSVHYQPAVGGGIGSATRVVIDDASGGLIANNVYQLQFDFLSPGAENNAAGYHTITVEGSAAAGLTNLPPGIRISYATRHLASGDPAGWTLETDSLIQGMAPSAVGPGSFAQFGIGSPGVSALTDGTYGNVSDGSQVATCGSSSGCGQSATYTLTNSVNGSDVTNIVVYSGWDNNGRDGQYYTVSYSTVPAPTTFIPITDIVYNPAGAGSPAVSDRVAFTTSTGAPLAKNVYSLKFDFSVQSSGNSYMDNGASLYAEIIVEGTNSAPPAAGPSPFLVNDTLPTYAETVVGDQVVFTAAYSNTPPAGLQWQVSNGAVTNNVNTGVVNVSSGGVTTSTLTLNNVQVSNSGTYLLNATNSIDNTALPSHSTGAQLAVSSTPAAVNNVIINYASQNFPSSTNFLPAWPVDTNNLNLIYGFTIGSGPGTFTYAGDFTGGGNYCNADPTVLSDGMIGTMTSLPNLSFCGCGPHISGAGESVTYTLVTNSAPLGWELTNITVFGGWQDAGRDEQKYQVLYSTVQAPNSFAPLVTADYLPTDPNNQPTVSRTMLVPASGVLAHNVAVLKISWNVSPQPENGWEGYSEILVGGKASTGISPVPTNDPPTTASDVVGSQIILTAAFSGASSLQWQKNGTNITGATTSTLTLNNLQLTNSGAYTLVGSNSAGSSSSSACTVTVIPAPTAVGNIITAIATQTSVAEVFTPTWDPNALSSSLIYNNSPSSSGEGDFTGGTFQPGGPTGGSLPAVLTDGTFGTIDFSQSGVHAWVTCMGSGSVDGSGNLRGGQYVIYTLPASANGYDITNIVTAGGWNDGGRDMQSYTVNYATSANPTYFTPLAMVGYNPTNPVGYSMVRATITPASGALASNVVALEFDMTTPVGENGFSGYSEIGVYGSPSANPPPAGLVITAEHQEDTTTWTAETPNLIAGQLPNSQGPGVFTSEGCNVTNLTDGVLGFGSAFGASCGADTNASVSFITFNSATGWNLTNIVVYALWHDYGRDGQFYNLSYSTLSAPATFLPLASVSYNPPMPHDGRNSGSRVAIAPAVGQILIASNVAAVKFDFTPQGTQDFGWSGYTEIVLQGSNLAAPTVPVVSAQGVVGGNLILKGVGGTPNFGYTVLTTTNLQRPIVNWTVGATGVLDNTGAFSNAIPINISQPAAFFRLRML